jgi:prevent-host-death family protein
MEKTNIHDAKTHLSRLIERVQQGEEIIIAKAGQPVARLVRYDAPMKPREGGKLRGLIEMSEDFDAPLPAEIESAFRGEAD